jgi:hypothetical protein
MLRVLVLVLVLLNVALFLWLRGAPTWAQGDREPQRLQRQVAPDAIQVLPDLPTFAEPAASAASATGLLSRPVGVPAPASAP